jgi:hypothetical protein
VAIKNRSAKTGLRGGAPHSRRQPGVTSVSVITAGSCQADRLSLARMRRLCGASAIPHVDPIAVPAH